jgi:putative membrane protein
MSTPLLIAATVFVGIAVLLHGYIFVMESITWRQPATWKRFGVRTQADADTTRPMAFNQGFYNLFLAIGAALGLVLLWTGATAAGAALVFLGAGSMVAAALVLVVSSPRLARAAAIQGAAPLLGIVLLALALTL